MLVEEIMTKDVITLKMSDSIESAREILQTNKFRHIPIIDDDYAIVGIISDRDVRDALPSVFEKEFDSPVISRTVSEIMKRNVVTIHPLEFVEDVSSMFYENEISCLPVIKEGKLVGIVTDKDMLNTLIQLTGALQPSSHIEVKVKNIPGTLAEVVSEIAKERVQINSVLVYPDHDGEHYKILVFRINTMNPLALVNRLKERGHCVLWPNLPGVSR